MKKTAWDKLSDERKKELSDTLRKKIWGDFCTGKLWKIIEEAKKKENEDQDED